VWVNINTSALKPISLMLLGNMVSIMTILKEKSSSDFNIPHAFFDEKEKPKFFLDSSS
jgi:hypothetical protein